MPTNPSRFLGVTVQPMYFQSEGLDAVLDSLAAAGVNAIATAPSIYEAVDRLPGDDDAGSSEELPRREPPVDAGAGSVRVVERLLWGKSEVLIKPSPSAAPHMEFYEGLPHRPSQATPLTESHGQMIQDVIDGAHARGMKVYFQVSAVQVPGRRDEDMPALPSGDYPRSRMVHTVSLASDDCRAYVCARVKDLLTSYPDIDGLRHDWPEYPPYRLGDAFLDFSDNARQAAAKLGFDFEEMQSAAGALYERVHRLTNDDLSRSDGNGVFDQLLGQGAGADQGLSELLRFKAALSVQYIRELREAMDAIPEGRGKELSPNAFPPPFSMLSGLDFGAVSEFADSISMKLYTMHWPQMVHFYAEELLEHNANSLDERLLVGALARAFDIQDGKYGTSLDDYKYPAPDVAHPAGVEAQKRKIRDAQEQVGDRADLYTLVHGYGPVDDFESRLRLAWDTSSAGIWINRYCYLGESKIEAIGRLGK